MPGPRLLRSINSVRLLRQLRRGAVRSRAELARELGLNRSSVGHAVNDLLAAGLLRETGSLEGGAGRPGIGLALDPDGALFGGAVLSSRAVRGVALDPTGAVRARLERPLGAAAGRGPGAVFALVSELLAELPSTAGIGADRLAGAGVALPGVVAGGVLRWAHDPSLIGSDVAALLAERVEAPVFVDNDANASALAELHLAPAGSEPPAQHLVYLYLEEGVGGGLVIGGDVFRGASGAAGEVGRIPLGPADPPELGPAARFGDRVDVNGLLELYRAAGGAADDADAVVAAFRAGEAEAAAAVDRWAAWLARGCVVLAKVLDPERIVIGGPLSELLPVALPTITAALAEASGSAGVPPPRVAVSSFGAEAGAMGAAALPYHAFFALPDVAE